MIVTIYNEHGEILRCVDCIDPEAQIAPGENYIFGQADDETHIVENGDFVSVPRKPNPFCVWRGEWIDTRTQQQIEAAEWRKVRRRRNALLAASDWTQLPDVPENIREAYKPYRQALRDITNFPLGTEFPTLEATP